MFAVSRATVMLSLSLGILAAGVTSCSRDRSPRVDPLAAGASSSAGSAASSLCLPLVEPGDSAAWKKVKTGFFEADIPVGWKDLHPPDGVEYRSKELKRRVLLQEILFSASTGVQPLQAIDRVLLRVRPQLAGSDTHAQLGPVRTAGDAAQPVQFFLVTAAGKAVFHALAGRRASDGGVRLVSLTYEDAAPGASEACVEKSALELLRRLVVLAAPVGPGAGDPVAPTLRFSQAAAAEIKRQLQPGDSVWIQAARSPSGMDYQLELRPPGDVAQDADRLAVDGISVAIDRASVVAVDGVTIDFLASAKGFVFHKQDSKP